MSRTKKTTEEAVEEVRSDTAIETEEAVEEMRSNTAIETEEAASGQPDEGKKRSQEKQIKEFLGKLPDPCVYCGPSVRGVARQYTVYHGGIPDALKAFIMEHRAAKGLIVSVERFAQVRTHLETPGTGEAILFRKVRAEL